MITSEDVRRVMFDKCMRGYRCEDMVDNKTLELIRMIQR